ncbi:MAG TPA: GPW/gp25 family protein, partial [Chitinophagaceae bacterium]|nr:GPW/gp25 family protein [Chitinophagaceae bacterium]
MAALANIENNTWSISTIGYGVVVEGLAVIRQRIDLVLRTTKRSDPLRPEFGSNIYQYIDTPLNVAIPNIKAEIIYALEMWVPEIKITSVSHRYNDESNPVFPITYQLLDNSLIDKVTFDVRAGLTTSSAITEIILQAFFPPNPNSYRYQVSLIRNSTAANPLPDQGGYSSISELFGWIMANWFFWGRWFLLNDRIVCYMNSEGVSNATLSISVLAIVRITADFPPLEPDQHFNVTLTVNGEAAAPAMPQTFNIPGEVLFWVQNNWGQYGTWSIEGVPSTSATTFSDEFSPEFDSPLPDTFKLILTSNKPNFT